MTTPQPAPTSNDPQPPAAVPYRKDADEPRAEAKSNTTDDGDVGQKQVQQTADREQEQGYVGVKVDLIDNAEYTLTTGPDSPRFVEDDRTRIEQHSSIVKKENADD